MENLLFIKVEGVKQRMNTFENAEIRLSFSEDGQFPLKPGQPAFWFYWRNDIALFEEPTWFLSQEIVSASASQSKNTWNAAAYDLKVWFQYLQATHTDWRAATEKTREEFADDLSSAISPTTGQKYGALTVNRRLTTVRRFYTFARKEGWYNDDIGESVGEVCRENRAFDQDALAHIRPSSGLLVERDQLLRKVARNDVIRPLQVASLRNLLNRTGPTAGDCLGDTRRVRDRLILDLGWVCGLRLGDVVGLTTLKIMGIVVAEGQELQKFPLVIERSKGGVTRHVGIPGWLVKGLQHYIQTERASSERASKKRPTHALFLGHANSKGGGQALTRSAIQKMFALNCIQCGLVESVSTVDPDSGQSYLKTTPAHSFHDLRHNCAVLTYHAEKALGNPEPWKVVQLVLGHKNLKTTIDTYLAYVEIFGEKQGIVDTRQLVGLR